jgi:hypothetical protein
LFLWFVGACLVGRHPLTGNPGLPFVGWILLAHALIPATELAAGRWPRQFHRALWVVMAVGYSVSGIGKLASPSWIDGTALERLLAVNPLVRHGGLRDAGLALPAPLLQVATWGTLALELCFAPLALVRSSRRWLWGAALAMHVSLLLLVDFADLTCGMLALHAFTFDRRWWRRRSRARRRTQARSSSRWSGFSRAASFLSHSETNSSRRRPCASRATAERIGSLKVAKSPSSHALHW